MRRLTVIIFALAASPAAWAGSRANRTITIPDLSPAERALFEDVRDDKLDAHDAVTGALAASDQAAAAKAKARWQEFLAALKADIEPVPDKQGRKPPPMTSRDKAQLVLSRMHGKLLTGSYDFFQNDMAKLLLEGSYNCVTTALVYQAAGEALGLDVRGVIVPSHVYVRVNADGVSWDVETTSASGFLLAQDDAAYKKFLEKMQLDAEKKIGRKLAGNEKFSRTEIDPPGMIALLYVNRGAFAVEQKEQKKAIGLFARSALLAQDERYARDSRDVLLAQSAEKQIQEKDYDEARLLLKFAIRDPGGDPVIMKRLRENIGWTWEVEAQDHLDAKRWESAFSSLSAAREYSNDPAITHNQKATLNMWGMSELEGKHFDKAADVFYRATKSFPDDPDFRQNLVAVYYEWTQALLAKNDHRGALERAKKLPPLVAGDPKAAEVVAYTAIRWAETYATKGDFASAVPLYEEAYAATPTSVAVRDDLVVVLTNAGVAWARAGNKDKARTAWRRALTLDPKAEAAKTNLDRISQR